MRKVPALVALAALTLSGCAMQQGDFPSLQKRPYEDEPAVSVPALPETSVSSLSPAVQAALDAAVVRSTTAHDGFLARLPAVQRRVDAARNAAVSSESWVAAQMELAALETQRSPSVEALADIDALYRAQLETESTSGVSGGTASIGSRRGTVQAQVDRQRSEMDKLTSRLR